jgi:hypothetical protein
MLYTCPTHTLLDLIILTIFSEEWPAKYEAPYFAVLFGLLLLPSF